MKWFKILRYGLMKRFKRGVRISMALTFRCNLHCPYCVVDKPTGATPKVKESTFEELTNFIKNRFPYRIREIKLTGGSPELHKDFVKLANWILDEGYFLIVFTNLMRPDILRQIKPSRKLMFIASYHHAKEYNFVSIPVEKYTENYNMIKKDYRIIVEEIGDCKEDKWLPFSRQKNFLTEKEMQENKAMIRVNPDLRMYCNCWDVYENN